MTDKQAPPKITPAPDVSKYDEPSKGLLGDVLNSADKTLQFNEVIAKGRREKEDRKQSLRDSLEIRCAADKIDLQARFDRQLKPILDLLEALPPAADGRRFRVDVCLSADDIDRAVGDLDESKYRGPRLHATVRYDDGTSPADARYAGDGSRSKQPVLGIEIGPDRILPEEKIAVTRFDVLEPSFYGQGGAGPEAYATRQPFSYTDLRRELGKWLGDVAPERVPDVAAAARPKLPPGKRGPKL